MNTISGYTAPTADHDYKIKHGLRYAEKFGGEEGRNLKPQRYIDKIIQRAQSCIAPWKYTDQHNWRQSSIERPNLALPKEAKVTMTAQTMNVQKKLPGPSHYKHLDPAYSKKRVLGVYNSNQDIVSHIESHQFVKKEIPAPTAYESRGKSMQQLSLERKAKDRYTYDKTKGLSRCQAIKKNDVAGPTSYEVPEALQQSTKLRNSIKSGFPKAKNINYIRSLIALKNKVPGVGIYATENS